MRSTCNSGEHGENKSYFNSGEKNCNAVLTKEDVTQIRSSVKQGVKQTFLARKYGVCKEQIWRIVNKRSWK